MSEENWKHLNIGAFAFLLSSRVNPYVFCFSSAGGKKFEITKDVLLRQKGSYFESMLLSDHSQQDSSGRCVMVRVMFWLFSSFLKLEYGIKGSFSDTITQ